MQSAPLCVAILGGGAIASAIVSILTGDPEVHIGGILRRRDMAGRADLPVVKDAGELDRSISLVVEAAGVEAVREHGPAILAGGRDLALLSTAALADEVLYLELTRAARTAHRRLMALSGAVGGVDALWAARVSGLKRVHYVGRKPPRAWTGTPAAEMFDLESVRAATRIFRGSAREAVVRYPKNANVAATIALAGMGFDRTEVTLIADPASERNTHAYEVQSAASNFRFESEGLPTSANQKSSVITACSAVAFLRSGAGGFEI